MKKRRITAGAAIILILALAAFGTLSYFTYTGEAENVITTGSIEIQINEKTPDGEDYPEDGVTVMPGDTVDKILTIENTGESAAYVRVKVTVSVSDETLTADDCVTLDIDTENWTYQEDGYYYYNTVLEPGESTEPLFTQASFDLYNIDNDYLGTNLYIDAIAYAVQSDNNGDDPLTAAGWPED